MKCQKSKVTSTSDVRKVDEVWLMLGGHIENVRRTGENRYRHDALEHPLRVNGRRKDAPAKLLTIVNRITKLQAANEDRFLKNERLVPEVKMGLDGSRDFIP